MNLVHSNKYQNLYAIIIVVTAFVAMESPRLAFVTTFHVFDE